MVDTLVLEGIISDSGKKKTYLADKIGISVQNLRLKMNNKSEFRSNEVDVLCQELGITRLTDKEKIFFKKYRENNNFINAIVAHHGDVEPQTVIAVLVQAADAVSAARPGARRENLENYIKRLEKLEEVYIESLTMTREKYEEKKAAILAKLAPEEPEEEKLPDLADLEKVRALFEGNIEEVYETFTLEERREFWRNIVTEVHVYGKDIKGVKFMP